VLVAQTLLRYGKRKRPIDLTVFHAFRRQFEIRTESTDRNRLL
jgi:hypothetical protein